MAIFNDFIKVEGMAELTKKLDALLTSDPEMQKRIRGIIGEVIKEVRDALSREASSGLKMSSDPRQAYRAVRSAVYRSILGGQVNILQKRKAGTPRETLDPPPRQGRGGNRVKRSDRTKALQSYWGSDRGFVLRFLDLGTYKGDRTAGTRGGRLHGNRGQIAARNWFGGASRRALEHAAGTLTNRIEELIHERFGG